MVAEVWCIYTPLAAVDASGNVVVVGVDEMPSVFVVLALVMAQVAILAGVIYLIVRFVKMDRRIRQIEAEASESAVGHQ